MANTTFQLRRSSVAGKVPNTSTLSTGELGLNLTDKILYSSDGTNIFEIGANNTNVNISGNLTVKAIKANGSLGTAGQVLASNGTATYWTSPTTGDITGVAAGNGLTGGGTSGDVTVSVLANTGIVANATGVYVNSAYIGTLAANSATYLGGNTASDLRTYSDNKAANAYSNAVSYVDGKSYVNTSQLSSNLANYQTTAGLSANVATLTSNNSTYAFDKTEGNLNVNSAVYANASITNTFTVGTGTYFAANGNVGIGTSSPAYRLDINGETRILNNQFVSGSLEINKFGSGNRYAFIDLVGDDTYTDYGTRLIRNNTGSNTSSVLYHRGTGDLRFTTQEAAPITFYTNNSERMRIDASGNVGIGNTAPADKLSVNGTTYLQANVTLNAALVANGSTGTAGQVLHSNGTATYWAADDAGVTSIATNNGLTGGTITSTGTISVLANTGIVANATGVYVNAAYINTISSNSATYANASITNTFTVGTASYFTSAGKLGVGTSSPDTTSKMTIRADNSVGDTPLSLYTQETAGSRAIRVYDFKIGRDVLSIGHGSSINAGLTANDVGITSFDTGAISFGTGGGSEKMRIAANGNIGIGNTSPDAKLTIEANSSNAALRITQTGTGNALVVEDSTNPDSTPFVVDTSGRVGIGTLTPSAYVTDGVAVVSSSSYQPGLNVVNTTVDNSAGALGFTKLRGTGAVISGDNLGYVTFSGFDGTSYQSAARITCSVDGTPGTNDMPGRLVFSTTADGASSPTERMRIDSSGNVLPGADNSYNLGSTSLRWANVYTGDLHLSNERTKGNDIDGTTGNWTIQEGETELYIINNKSGKKFKFKLEEIQ